MNLFNGKMKFHGTFRSYQQRVLDHSNTYLNDRKMHIVAAPGSGKTTLGIELILRLGKPCLILSPSITIKEQWASRIQSAFLNENEKIEDWVSGTIKSPKAITTITYQALHSAYQKLNEVETKTGVTQNEEQEEDDLVNDQVPYKEDFSQFDLFQTIKDAGIQTLCLDEAHHLRSEWWKALEELVKQFPSFTIISLTATPPYDSTPAQWQKYISLCGPIDEEIFTPELVKDKSLCPHQDYVYFNYPTQDELQTIEDFKEKSEACLNRILENKNFTEAIAGHKGLQMEQEYTSFFLERPDYFYSILVFLTHQGIPLSPYIKGLVGKNGTLPKLNKSFMEQLLQGFLYDDVESYENSDSLREEILTYLKSNQCIVKKKVTFISNDTIQKMFISSKGKLNSILTIANSEFASLGKNLRQLILCDYIKREFINNVGKEDVTINETGVIPIFELLRRQKIEGLKLGVLCGTIILIPESATGTLDYLLVDHDATAKYQPLGETGYVQVQMSGKNSLIVHLITLLFEQGEMQILIGTKSLLGEGWDSPCINSLILASFVGSFMLSNQMRGRAIRMFKNDPDKISNIWHLLCVEPGEISTKGNLTAGYASSWISKAAADTSPDYEMLKRRFESFLGVSYTENVIENGLQRLSIIKEPFTEENVNSINQQMLTMAADREALKEKWEKALFQPQAKNEIAETLEANKALTNSGYNIKVPLKKLLVFLAGFLLSNILRAATGGIFTFVFGLAQVIFFILSVIYGIKAYRLFQSSRKINKIASALLSSLRAGNHLEENSPRVFIQNKENGSVLVRLNGGSTRDQTTFVKSLEELLGDVSSPRYLMVRKKKGNNDLFQYLSVPECLGKKKQDAELLRKNLTNVLGEYDLYYAHTKEGQTALLKARTHCVSHSKKDLLKRSRRL